MIRLLRLQARRDRVVLPVWVLGVALLLLASAQSVHTTYGDTTGRTSVLTLALSTPALLALRGEPNGASLGSAVHFQSYAFLAVAVALMNTFLAVRHGRGDEERGRRELLDAAPVPRTAAVSATVALGLAANGALAGLAVLGYRSAGLPLCGALLSAGALALTGVGFLGVGLLAGEALPTSRAANGAAVTAALVAYALRAAGDALGRPDAAALRLDPAWPNALSPIGWGEAVLPFTADHGAPLLGLVAFAVVPVALAVVVRARREAGASLVRSRPGPAAAGPSLGSPFGLAWRLGRGAVLGWAVGAALLGLVAAPLVSAAAGARLDDPRIAAVVRSLGHTRGDLADGLLTAILLLAALLAAAAGVQAALRAAEEETAGRAQALLAAPRSRAGWIFASAGVAAGTIATVLLATAAAAALGYAVRGDADGAWRAVGQTLVAAPASAALAAVALLCVGVAPRVAPAPAWALYAVAVAVGLFGGLLGLSDDAVRLTPIGSVPALPSDDWGPTAGMAAVAVVLTGLAVLAVRRRDLAA